MTGFETVLRDQHGGAEAAESRTGPREGRGVMAASDYVDQALEVLGGEDTEFWLTGRAGEGCDHAVLLSCRCRDSGGKPCEWGLFVGEMELWEFITDAREHWETEHAAKRDAR